MATFDYLRRNGESVEQTMKRLCDTYYNFKSTVVYQKYIDLCNEQYDLFYTAVNMHPNEREFAVKAFNNHVYMHGNLMDWLRHNKYGVGKNWIDSKENPKCLITKEEIEAAKLRILKSN